MIKNANIAPAITDSSVRRLQIAKTRTRAVGSKLMAPYSITDPQLSGLYYDLKG